MAKQFDYSNLSLVDRQRLHAARFKNQEQSRCDICKNPVRHYLQIAIDYHTKRGFRSFVMFVCSACEKRLTVP